MEPLTLSAGGKDKTQHEYLEKGGLTNKEREIKEDGRYIILYSFENDVADVNASDEESMS